MISDQDIVYLLTTRARGGQITFINSDNPMQEIVDEQHQWDFINNTYLVTGRWTTDADNQSA